MSGSEGLCPDHWATVQIGDRVLVEHPKSALSMHAVVNARSASGRWVCVEGISASYREADGWTLVIVERAWRAPVEPGWYASHERLRAHGLGSSIRLYRHDGSDQWFMTRATGDPGVWQGVAPSSLPRDLVRFTVTAS
jgi:hypothetical protein